MIQNARKRSVAIAAIVIVVALVSTWWYYASPAQRALALPKIQSIIVLGTTIGAVYALLAVGFTLIYGVAEVVNLAHGGFFMLGTYMFFALGLGGVDPRAIFQLGLLPAIILAVILTGIVGSIIYRLIIHPIVEDQAAVLVVTVGVAIIFQQLIRWRYTDSLVPIATAFPEWIRFKSLEILGVSVPYSRLLAFSVSLILFAALWIFIAKTKIGTAMRAVAQDREVAMLMGINTTRVYMLTMAISSSLAAIAGILISASTTGVAGPLMWLLPLVLSFSTVILGGLGSIKGTLVAAFIIGYAENAAAFLIPEGSFLKATVALAVMVTVLLLRPKGLFGKRIELE